MAYASNSGLTLSKSTVFAAKAETAEGTPATDAAGDVMAITPENIGFTLGRDPIATDVLLATLSKQATVPGMYQVGCTCQTLIRGSGTQGTAPRDAPLLKNAFGDQFDGAAGTISSPSTTALTTSGTATEGGHLRIEVGAAYQIRRCLTEATKACTFWPPVNSAPGTSDAVQSGNAFLLTTADRPTLTGVWYFGVGSTSPKKLVLTGLRVTAMEIALETGKPGVINWTLEGLGYAVSYTAISYTVPNLGALEAPPICLGLSQTDMWAGTQDATSAVGAVVLNTDAALSVAVGDRLYIDVGANYESQTITSVADSGTTQITLGHSNFSAVSSGSPAYIMRDYCAPAATLALNYGKVDATCMNATYGKEATRAISREVTLEYGDKRFIDWDDVNLRDSPMFSEVSVALGSEEGNIAALSLPRWWRTDVALDHGDGLMNAAPSGFGGMEGSGDDELWMTYF